MITKRSVPIYTFIFLSLLVTFSFASYAEAAKTKTINLSIITPEGSTWTNVLGEFAKEVKEKTKGSVEIKLFPGGITGGEVDVLRKMRVSKSSQSAIHAAGFSGVGLGIILPEFRVLEAPLLFKNYQEVDAIKEKFYSYFEEEFRKKRYELLGFAEAGFVFLFSKQKITTAESLKKTKMWVWKDDKVAVSFLEAFGIPQYPLDVTQVSTSLQTGMIDSFYSPLLAAHAFQWYTQISYAMDFQFVDSMGALLIRSDVFKTLSADEKKILKDLGKRHSENLVKLTRKDNESAYKKLEEAGVTFLKPSASDIKTFQDFALKNHQESAGKIYSKKIYDDIKDYLDSLRK